METFLDAIRPYDAQAVSFVITSVTAIILWLIQARVKLRWGFQHGFNHRVDPAAGQQEDKESHKKSEIRPIMVRTASYWIANEGRKTAHNIEVTFNYHPDNYSVWPQRNYTTVPNPEGRLIFKFSSVSPKESFTINLINIGSENPNLLSMRSDESSGKEVPIIFVKKYPQYVYISMASLMAVGLFGIIYAVVSLRI